MDLLLSHQKIQAPYSNCRTNSSFSATERKKHPQLLQMKNLKQLPKLPLTVLAAFIFAIHGWACIKVTTEGQEQTDTQPGHWGCDSEQEIMLDTTRCAPPNSPAGTTGVGIYKIVVTGDLQTTYRIDTYDWINEPDTCGPCPAPGAELVIINVECVNLTLDPSTLTFDRCQGSVTI